MAEARGVTKGIRTGIRIPLELPVRVQWQSSAGSYRQVEGKTGSISGNGLFMTVPARPPRKAPIVFTIPLPPEVTGIPVELRGQGHVVRWQQLDEGAGVGVIIDDYMLGPVH